MSTRPRARAALMLAGAALLLVPLAAQQPSPPADDAGAARVGRSGRSSTSS